MNIEDLAALRSPGGSLVSVYIERPLGQVSAALTDVLKPLKAKSDALPRAVAMSLRSDLERIAALESRIDSEMAPGYWVFASDADGIFELGSLSVPVGSHASIGRRPYLRPLRALPRSLRGAVAVSDRRNAWLYVWNGGSLDALDPPVAGEALKDNYGGFRGYEEHGVRQRAAEEAARVLKEAAERLFAVHQERPLDFLAVGGHKASLDDLVPYLHPYLQNLPRRTFVIDPHTMTPAVLADRIETLADDIRSAEMGATVEAVLEAVSRGEQAGGGLIRVLEAANAHAPDLLAVSSRFTSPGMACPQCQWLGLGEQSCPVCSIATDEIEDVVGEVIEAVISTGGRSVETGESEALDKYGIAARLRFPV